MAMTSRICSFVKPAAMNESSSCSLKCPRFSMSVFARVESAANRLSAGYAPLADRVGLFRTDPCWSASAVWNATAYVAGVRDCVCQQNNLILLPR